MPVKYFIARDTGLNTKRKVLYRKFHEINKTVFLVEVCRDLN